MGNIVGSNISAAAGSFDGVESVVEIDIEAQIDLQLGGQPSIFADGAAGSRDGNERRLAWANAGTGDKINWYFFAPTASLTLNGLRSIYAILNKTGTRAPFIFVYTKPLGDGGDLGGWYRSRVTFERAQSATETGFMQLYAKADADVEYGLGALPMTENYGGQDVVTGGYRDEDILYIGIGTDSSEGTAGAYDFALEEFGYQTVSGSKSVVRFTSAAAVDVATSFTAATDYTAGRVAYLKTDGEVEQWQLGAVTNGGATGFGSAADSVVAVFNDEFRTVMVGTDGATGNGEIVVLSGDGTTVAIDETTNFTPAFVHADTDGSGIIYGAVIANSGVENATRIHIKQFIYGAGYAGNTLMYQIPAQWTVGNVRIAVGSSQIAVVYTVSNVNEVRWATVQFSGGAIASGVISTSAAQPSCDIAHVSGDQFLIAGYTSSSDQAVWNLTASTGTLSTPVTDANAPVVGGLNARIKLVGTDFWVLHGSTTSGVNIRKVTISPLSLGPVATVAGARYDGAVVPEGFVSHYTPDGATDPVLSAWPLSGNFVGDPVPMTLATGRDAAGSVAAYFWTGEFVVTATHRAGFTYSMPQANYVTITPSAVPTGQVAGVFAGDGLAGSLAEVKIDGQEALLSGLTPGLNYYAGDYGAITTVSGDYPQLGRALSSTRLLVDIDEPSSSSEPTDAISATTIKAVYHNGTTWVAAQANDADTLATMVLIGADDVAGTKVRHQKLEFTGGHGYGAGGDTLYLSAVASGLITATKPTSGEVQILGYVIDANTIVVAIDNTSYFGYESATSSNIPSTNVSGTGPTSPAVLGTVTAPSAGKWRLNARLGIDNRYNDAARYDVLVNGSRVVDGHFLYYVPSGAAASIVSAETYNIAATLDLGAGDIVTVQVYTANSSTVTIINEIDGNRLEIEKVAGYLPVANQAEYLFAKIGIRENYTPGTYVSAFVVDNAANLTLTDGKFVTLRAGVTYEVDVALSFDWLSTTQSWVSYDIRDTGGIPYGSSGLNVSANYNSRSAPVAASAIITPSTNITIGVYVTAENEPMASDAGFGYFNVRAIAHFR